MIKVVSAFTDEVDDANLALKEITDGLGPLLANSVGIITCTREHIENENVKVIVEHFPFDIVGCESSEDAATGSAVEGQLSLMVLTSDDAEFSTVLTDPLEERTDRVPILEKAFASVSAQLTRKPMMMLVFIPPLRDFDGDVFLDSAASFVGDTPIFGTLAINFERFKPYVLYGREAADNKAAFILIADDSRPEFFSMKAVSQINFNKYNAVATKTSDNLVQEIDGDPPMKFFESIGFATIDSLVGLVAAPLVFDLHDGGPIVVRAIYGLTPEGWIRCSASAPQGASIALGILNKDAVLDASHKIFEKINAQNGNGALIFSCISRQFILTWDEMAELELAVKMLECPFIMGYSGGEVCPVQEQDGKMSNSFQSMLLIACVFNQRGGKDV
ncbi:FIST C-terminal domain-containing protein [Lachnospiraceae bacterium ZAX-1]